MANTQVEGVPLTEYATGPLDGYWCFGCRVEGVRLWREYSTVMPDLLCVDCAEREQAAGHAPGWQSPHARGEGDQIGWMVPAVPCPGGYWGYTSVPPEGIAWWESLPLRKGERLVANS
jgi:hypothetical protein